MFFIRCISASEDGQLSLRSLSPRSRPTKANRGLPYPLSFSLEETHSKEGVPPHAVDEGVLVHSKECLGVIDDLHAVLPKEVFVPIGEFGILSDTARACGGGLLT
ncbi:MAG: hypothetical protein M1838_003787 [Thelocarpon superellum]|nr:MAG: hypothetical protein M1838_003787 [Thelocarpon superellum]